MENNINPFKLDEEVDKPNEKADRRHKGIKLKDIIYYSKTVNQPEVDKLGKKAIMIDKYLT